jgi:regulator of sigma E protease
MNMTIAFILVFIINSYLGYSVNIISDLEDYSPAATASTPLEAGDEIISYGGKRVHVPYEIIIYLQDAKGAPADITFKRDGVLQKTMITPDFTPGKRYILGFSGVKSYGPDWNLISKVSVGDPADLLGIAPGDRLLTVAGKTPASRVELRGILAEAVESGGADGAEVDVTWVKADGTPASGRIATIMSDNQDTYSLGVYYSVIEKSGILGNMQFAYYTCISFSKMVLYSLKWMATGAIGLNQVSGPVGIVAEIGAGVEETSKSQYGIIVVVNYVMSLSALIGINLGLFNLIPFPPLDGSKLLLLGIEAIRRKDIPPERQMAISIFGMVVLVLIMALTFFSDIVKLVNK